MYPCWIFKYQKAHVLYYNIIYYIILCCVVRCGFERKLYTRCHGVNWFIQKLQPAPGDLLYTHHVGIVSRAYQKCYTPNIYIYHNYNAYIRGTLAYINIIQGVTALFYECSNIFSIYIYYIKMSVCLLCLPERLGHFL